jgi:4-carboxymuconolactone decarboxylase
MKTLFLTLFIIAAASFGRPLKAQSKMNTSQHLDKKQQSIVSISALTATGDIEKLKNELGNGLDSGLAINEIKEVLVQLYAYCGFPRSLNGISTFMTVVKERKARGISDKEGPAAALNAGSGDSYERGRAVLETLTKTPQAKPAPGFGEFAPRIDAFLKEHLFADIFESDVLTYRQRELATISALAAMSGITSQLQAHIGMGMNTGLTESELLETFAIIDQNISKDQGDLARSVLKKVVDTKK